jgi:hypothetical protein
MRRKGNLDTVGGNANQYSHSGEQWGGYSKKLKIELPMIGNPTAGDLSKWKKISVPKRHVHSHFTLAKVLWTLRCPSVNGWMKKMWYMYTMEP